MAQNLGDDPKKKIAAKLKIPRHYTIRLEDEGHVIWCGDVPLRTPAGRIYTLPTEALAMAVAAEWREQAEAEKLDVASLPLSQLVATALDIVAPQRTQIVSSLLAYSTTELLCHRAEFPLALSERQEKIWQPILEWCALRYGALMRVGTGLMPISQTPDCVMALERAIEACDVFRLTGLRYAVETSTSLVLGLALMERARRGDEVFYAAELEALFQTESWGQDPVTSARLESVQRDLSLAQRWFDLL